MNRVEFKWELTPSSELPDDGGSWKLENVSGKLIANRDDVLTYRLVYSSALGQRLGNSMLVVKVWPELPEHGRREGRPEAGFMVTPPSQCHIIDGTYCVEPTHSLVVVKDPTTGEDRVCAIYFALEDCNYEDVGPPLWRLSVDESMLMARMPALQGRWIPLPPVHPDPLVNPEVPIQRRRQRSPFWDKYRMQAKHYAIFKGKLSASRMFDFIAGRFFNDRGKGSTNLIRFGRGTEAKVILTHLMAYPGYVASECGTHPHPRVEDSCGTADAFLEDPSMTFNSLPEWNQQQWLKKPEAVRNKIKWSDGIVEAKTMLKQDYKKLGPVIKAEHLCQMYWTMLCTERYWGDYIRTCYETRESRVYRVRLVPLLARKLEACVLKMQQDMIAGIDYETACDTDLNHEVVDAFRKQAIWYNKVTVTEKGLNYRYTTVAWPTEQVALLEKMCSEYDVFYVDRPAPAIEPARKKPRKKAAKAKTVPPKMATPKVVVKEEPMRMSAASIMPMVDQQQRQTIAKLVEDLDTTHTALVSCLQNGHYGEALRERVFHAQVCRLLELHGICRGMDAVRQYAQEEEGSVMEQDE